MTSRSPCEGDVVEDGSDAAFAVRAGARAEQVAYGGRPGAVLHDHLAVDDLVIAFIAVAEEHEHVVPRQHIQRRRGEDGRQLERADGAHDEIGEQGEGQVHDPDQHFAVFGGEDGPAVLVRLFDVPVLVDDDRALFVEDVSVRVLIAAVYLDGDIIVCFEAVRQFGHLRFHLRGNFVEVGEREALVREGGHRPLQFPDELGNRLGPRIRRLCIGYNRYRRQNSPPARSRRGCAFSHIRSSRLPQGADRGDDAEQKAENHRDELAQKPLFFFSSS